MALCANFCATNMDPRFMALEDFSKLFHVPHPPRHFNCQWGPQRFRRWSFLGTKRFLIIFRFSQGGWIPIIGELFDTGVVSAIRDWKIVIDSIMATPRRENLSTNTHVLWGLEDISTVKNCLESSSGAWEPWRKKKFLPHRKGWVGKGAVATASGGLDEEQKEENVHTPLLPSYLSKDYHWWSELFLTPCSGIL